MKISLILLLAVTALLPCGCGTVCNLASSDPANYGGVQKDVEWMSTKGIPHLSPGTNGTNPLVLVFRPAVILTEVGLSLTADTLALSYTVYENHKNHQNGDLPSSENSARETVIQLPSAD